MYCSKVYYRYNNQIKTSPVAVQYSLLPNKVKQNYDVKVFNVFES